MPSKKLPKVKSEDQKRDKKVFSYLSLVGSLLIIVALFIPLNIFSPVLKAEVGYQFSSKKSDKNITPVNTDFSIVIPKINANTKIIKNVDPFNPVIYQKALTQGVAHASTSSTPDTVGSVFVFAHSAGNWYQANQYNAVFYLLNKLNLNDQIFVYYQNKKYTYQVEETKLVSPKDISYLDNNFDQSRLTLMTCWPPGTTLKRLIVIANLQSVD